MTPIRDVAMRIKQLRRKRKMSQAALAEAAGISRTYLARLETSRQDPTLSTLEKPATALGVPVRKLLG
jgi:transcriptional regulator with XRE-family HTH domain